MTPIQPHGADLASVDRPGIGLHREGLRHRPEIDGLRALAVVPVILFHAGFGQFSGGYVGVDVFFVISGFLITSIIAAELQTGNFSLVRFYERRARRILPALFVVMFVTLPAAWLTMLPQEAIAYGKSLIAVSIFLSNMLFWRTSGYFDLVAEEKPLLHTWSLGVEEQFYVFFPILLAMLWRLGIRRSVLLLIGLACLSLAASQWVLERSALASFFLAPFRAWELLAGSLLALTKNSLPKLIPSVLRQVTGLLACALIMVPVAVYDAATTFPGVLAVPPVLGTVLILAFVTPDTWVGRFLTLRPILWVGAISYSAYLWHQPLFAFARLSHSGEPSPRIFLGLACLSLLLAHLSWRFVEAPFRTRDGWSRRSIFVGSALSTLVFVACGASLVSSQGLPQRWPTETRRLIDPPKTRLEGCPSLDGWLHVCRIGKAGMPGEVVLLGDSHAYALASVLDQKLAATGRSGYVLHTNCHPISGFYDSREANSRERIAHCVEANHRLLAFIAQSEVRGILVAIRWTARLYPWSNQIDAPAFDNHEGGIERDLPFRRNLALDDNGHMSDEARVKEAVLERYFSELVALRPTVVLDPVPEVGWNPPRLNLLGVTGQGTPPALITTSWARYQERNAVALKILQAVEGIGLQRSHPQEFLCNKAVAERCVVQEAGELYYADDDHLSTLGARWAVDDMLAYLP